MADLIREITSPSKRKLIIALRSGPQRVTDLVGSTGFKQPNVSNHLSRLKELGVVLANKRGREIYYSIRSSDIEFLLDSLQISIPPQDDRKKICLEQMSLRYAKTASRGMEADCIQMIDELLRHRLNLLDIYQGVLAQAMFHIGEWYRVSAISEAAEHLASAITERMLSRIAHFSFPVQSTGRKVVLGCVDTNYHCIGLRMISDYLRYLGWQSIYLGASVPTHSFLSMVQAQQPSAVLISCCRETELKNCHQLVDGLNDLNSRDLFKIGIGGSIVGTAASRLPTQGVSFVGTDLRGFAENIVPQL